MTATRLQTKSRPSNLDPQRQIGEAHECLHSVSGRVDQALKEVSELRHDTREQVAVINASHALVEKELARVNGVLDGMRITQNAVAAQIGVAHEDGDKKRGRPFGGLTRWQAIAAVVGATGGAQVLYRLLEPAIVAGAVALHAALMGH